MTCKVKEQRGWWETISLASVIKWSALTGVARSQLWILSSNAHLQVDQKADTICASSGKSYEIKSQNPYRESEPTCYHVGAIYSHEVQCGIKRHVHSPRRTENLLKVTVSVFVLSEQREKKHSLHVWERSLTPVFLGHFALPLVPFNGYCLTCKESQ